MRSFSGKHPKPVLAFLVLLLLGLGALDSSQQKTSKRNGPARGRDTRALKVEKATRTPRAKLATDRVLVKFKSGVEEGNAEAILQFQDLGKVRQIPGAGVYRAQAPPA